MRPVPRMVAAWCAGDGKKPFATTKQAYYAIAKALVVAKYPAWLSTAESVAIWEATVQAPGREGWTPDLVIRRRAKSHALFCMPWMTYGELEFDERKWTRFVRRVARFLEFVDRRRGEEALLDGIDPDNLEARYQYCETHSIRFARAADHYRAELLRRSST